MLTVDHYARIRQLRRDGLTIREIAHQLNHSPKTILKALAQPEPATPTPAEPRTAPVFGPFRPLVEAILQVDHTAPRKQRHTATQVHRRLVAEHGYTGGHDQVRRYLQQRRRRQRETFIPLDHPPGHRAEADFGHIHVDFPDGRRLVPVLLVTGSYSNAPFALAVPTERTEAILHGLVEAFAFFGCVPSELWWDNPTTVAIHVFAGRDRTLHPRYGALASHYVFTPQFCLPATPREKPRVENRVKDLERRWATPVPQASDLAQLNAHLGQCWREARQRTGGGQQETVGQRFEQDQAAAPAVPERPFDACVSHPAVADKYQTVPFDRNRYSVPARFAFRAVTVKGYVDRVVVAAEGQAIATHPRSYDARQKILDPLHFLGVLATKPAALDHAPVYRDGPLPVAFAGLRHALERRLGRRTAARQYIRVLRLLARHPVARVEQAIRAHLPRTDLDAASLVAAIEQEPPGPAAIPREQPPLSSCTVPRPDLAQFNQLLSRVPCGDDGHECCQQPVTEDQPEAVTPAHDAGRVREAGP